MDTDTTVETSTPNPVVPAQAPRKPYTPRAVITATKQRVLDFVKTTPAAPRTIADALGIEVRIASYCARALANDGAIVGQGNRSARVYSADPNYVAVPKVTRHRGPHVENLPIEQDIQDFLAEHAASAGAGVIANGIGQDVKAVRYHCRAMAQAGKLQFTGERRCRVYTVEQS